MLKLNDNEKASLRIVEYNNPDREYTIKFEGGAIGTKITAVSDQGEVHDITDYTTW